MQKVKKMKVQKFSWTATKKDIVVTMKDSGHRSWQEISDVVGCSVEQAQKMYRSL